MPALEQRYDQSSATEDSEDFVNANTAPTPSSPRRNPSSTPRPPSSAGGGRPSSRASHASGGSRHSAAAASAKVHSSSSSESELSDSEEERQLQEELDDAGGVEGAGAVRGAPGKKAWIMQSVSKGRPQSREKQRYAALDAAEAGSGTTRKQSRRSSRSAGEAGEQVQRSSSRSGRNQRDSQAEYTVGKSDRSSTGRRHHHGKKHALRAQYAIGKADPEKGSVKSGNSGERASKSKKKIWLGVLGAILLIIVIMVVVFVVIDQTKKSSNEDASSTAESAAASNGTVSATGSNSLSTAQEPASYGNTATFKSGTEAPGSPTTTYDNGQYHSSSAAATAAPTGLSSLNGDDEHSKLASKSGDLLGGVSSAPSGPSNGIQAHGSSASSGADDLLTLGVESIKTGASATGENDEQTGLLTLGGVESEPGKQSLPTQAQSGYPAFQSASTGGVFGPTALPTSLETASVPAATGSSPSGLSGAHDQHTQQGQGQQTGWNVASSGNNDDGQQQQQHPSGTNSLSNVFGAQPTSTPSSANLSDPNAAATPTNDIAGGVWGAPSILPATGSSLPLGHGPQVVSQPSYGQQGGVSSQEQGQGQGVWGVVGGQVPTGASPVDNSAPSATDAWGAPAASPTQQGQYNDGKWNGDTSVGENPDDGQYHGNDAQGQQNQQNGNGSNNGQWNGAAGWSVEQVSEEAKSPYSNATAYQATAPESYQTYQGNGTWFENSGHYGACGIATNKTDFVVALSDKMWLQSTNSDAAKQSPQCNAEVLLTNKATGMSIKAWVTERCASCVGDASLDLSKPAFAALSGGSYEIGRLDIMWGFTGNVASSSSSSTGSSPLAGASSVNGLAPTAATSAPSGSSSNKPASASAASSTTSEEEEDDGWFRRRGLPTAAAQLRRRKRAL